jgi:uncharacterized membrane protein
MKGLELIFGFLLAQMMDILSTYYGIKFLDLSESNPLASLLFKTVGMDQVMFIKLLISLLLTFSYILSMKKFTKWHWSMEKSLQIGYFGSWIVVTLNIIALIWAMPYSR